MDDSPNLDVESTAFDKFLGVYVTLPGDDGESKVLARVKDQKRYHDGALIAKRNLTQASIQQSTILRLPMNIFRSILLMS